MNFSREIALFENLVIVHITLLVDEDALGGEAVISRWTNPSQRFPRVVDHVGIERWFY